jgi:DNA/RNA endonuclease G (NUC1)
MGMYQLLESIQIMLNRMLQTAEHLTLAALGKSKVEPPPESSESGDRQKSVFREDEAIPLPFRGRLQDYFRSGYDRGHMYGIDISLFCHF